MNQIAMFEQDLPIPIPLDKARAQHRAVVKKEIDDGLIVGTPAARNTDPETSHKAAAHIIANGSRASIQKRCLDMVEQLPGLTVNGIGKQLHLHSHTVGRRLSDLAKAQRIVEGPVRIEDGIAYTTYWPKGWTFTEEDLAT